MGVNYIEWDLHYIYCSCVENFNGWQRGQARLKIKLNNIAKVKQDNIRLLGSRLDDLENFKKLVIII